ncbi:MAG: 16S rRNA (guanine(966)-N(2))-methyltransferase RsmD [Spirochaetales bacterium]|jgi:16S rRNA (guanine966-N2)-methyltransferase|nr:16S rRNA (guanine(966)-N(2))-methyltransferase RsmD [Spirochaetales bacterium]
MRITGGLYGGRNIICPPGIIRPAMDRMRESIFSILGDLSGADFLDLYSGSGIIGIEASSRGAGSVILVEKDRRKLPVLKRNITFVETDIKIINMAAERYLSMAKVNFDYIFADPPFPQKEKIKILELISRKSLLRDKGTFLIHYPVEDTLPEETGDLILSDKRKYGRSIVNFYSRA